MRVIKIKNKKAVAGESILTIYRLVLVTIIALIILGISAVFYDYYIDVRGAEADILAKKVFNCLSPKGIINLDGLIKDIDGDLFDYCGLSNGQTERFYVKAKITYMDSSSSANSIEKILNLEQGDSGARWVRDFIEESGGDFGGEIKKYNPGEGGAYSEVNLIKSGKIFRGRLDIDVLVSHEF